MEKPEQDLAEPAFARSDVYLHHFDFDIFRDQLQNYTYSFCWTSVIIFSFNIVKMFYQRRIYIMIFIMFTHSANTTLFDIRA